MNVNGRKIKFGVSALDIISIIYIGIGAVFLISDFLVVRFVSQNPHQITGDIRIFKIVFGIIGSIFFILGIVFAVIRIRKRIRIKSLIESESYVNAVITGVSQNFNVTVNGRNPYVVECSYTDSKGDIYIFQSRNLFFDPTAYITDENIPVYVDSSNYKDYYVDIDTVIPEVKR